MDLKNESARCFILQDKNTIEKLESKHFDGDYWQDKPGFSPVDGGRGGSVKINLGDQSAILRQYKRGGLMTHISKDCYLWLGKNRSRPWREWQLLQQASDAGLSVAKPLGVCVWKRGLLYRAAIMTAYLEGTETLAERLADSALDSDIWFQLGSLLKKMQSLGFRHADLNANNLLIDQDSKLYIIDFDKGRVMKKLGNWQWAPLYRLQRSLVKIDRQHTLHYGDQDWQALMDGYQSSL